MIDSFKFQDIVKDNPFRLNILGRVTVGKKCIVVLELYNPPRNCNSPEQYNNNENDQDGT